jgi:hypothetical protein
MIIPTQYLLSIPSILLRLFLTSWIICTSGYILNAQIIYKEYLESANQTPLDSVYNNMAAYYSSNILGRPFINRIEFRSETRDFRMDRQEYTLRLSTSNPAFNMYQKSINQLEKTKIDLFRISALADEIYTRYKKIGRLETLYKRILNYRSELELLDKLIQLNKSNVIHLTKESLENYYGSIIKYNNIELELEEDQFEYRQLVNEILPGKDSVLHVHAIADLNEIYNYITNFTSSKKVFLEDSINQIEHQVNRLEFNQRKSNENKILDHFQLRYQSDPEEMLNRNLSIGIGLRIPGLIKHNYLMEEYQLKVYKASLNQTQFNKKYFDKLSTLQKNISKLKHQYEIISLHQDKLSQKFTSDQFLKSGNLDLSLVLEMKLQINSYQKKVNTLNAEALEILIEFLYLTDHFTDKNTLFYLSLPFNKM